MKIRATAVGMVQANCYLVATEQKNALMIDPGGNPERILRYLKEDGLTLSMILLTHGHFDHIAALWELLELFPEVPIYISAEDGEMLECIDLSLCGITPLFFKYREHTPYRALQDGETIQLDELNITFVHTPGHSKGSGCYRMEDALFTGDTLFAGGMGRTDLYGGDYAQIKQSLQKLAGLEGDPTVYPGHGPASTLAKERSGNPYMGQGDYDDYF